jgi:outer membrane protein assembly factor BamB
MQPLIYLRDNSLFTLPRGLKVILDQFGQGGKGQWEVVLAASVIATLPMLVIFFLGQHYFVEGSPPPAARADRWSKLDDARRRRPWGGPVGARRSWLMLTTLAVVCVAVAVGVVAWDGGRARPEPARDPAQAWSATLHTPPDPVVSPVQRASAAVQVGPPPTSAVQLQLAGGTLYVRDSGRVRALDPRSGRERWVYPAGPQGLANLEVVSFVADVEATAVAVRRTGGSGPEGLVVLLDPATGRPRWQRRVGGEVYPDSLAVGPAGVHLVAQDFLTSEELAARLRRDDRSSLHPRLTTTGRGGRLRWQRPLQDRGGRAGLLGDAIATTAGGRVVVIEGWGWGADVEAFDAATGAGSWGRRVRQAGGALAWGDRLLLNLWDRRPVVRAVDGTPLRADFLPAELLASGPPTPTGTSTSGQFEYRLAGDTLYVFANDRLAAVDLRAGTVRWQVPTGVELYHMPWWERILNPDAPQSDRPFSASGVTVRDGRVLVVARDRCLYVVDDRAGAVAGRQCGLPEPRPGSPLISTPEVTVYRTLGELVAYPLRTG